MAYMKEVYELLKMAKDRLMDFEKLENLQEWTWKDHANLVKRIKEVLHEHSLTMNSRTRME